MNILYGDPLDFGNIASWSVHNYEVLSGLSRLGHNVVLINGKQFRNNMGTAANRQSLSKTHSRANLFWSRLLQPIRGEGIILWLFLRDIWSFLQAFMTIVRQKERFDLIYERDHQFSSEYLLAKLFRIPLVKEVNGLLVDEAKISGQAGKVALRMMGRIDRFNKPKADKIIVVTSRLKEILQEDDGVPSDKITVIQNGANIDLFKPMDVTKAREELGLNQSHKYVCFVGAFRAWEGIENIVKSTPLVLQKCPEARFLIVGDGPMKQELINLAEQVGVSDKVIFTGMVPYQEVPLYINASDVCVFPAAKNFRNDRTGGSPLKLHEYMACGKPVVVGNITGVSEHIMDTDSGFVVDPTNAIEMARAIIALLENEQLRKEMGERGRKVTIEKYSWMKVAEQVAEVCQSVIKNRR